MTSASALQQLRDLVAKAADHPSDAKAREESFVFGTLRCEDPSLSREAVIAALRACS
ncbi:MAG: hypothetical protein IPL79_17480 [Myxococcales bacterium]|nr:hypothetical protein [Myxococcales bacterium]